MNRILTDIRLILCMITAMLLAASSLTPAAAFADEEEVSNDMTIYALYLTRDDGTVVSTDRYGDATLIESDGKFLLIDTGAVSPIKDSSEVHYSTLVKLLQNIGVEKLDIMLSHMHGDHTGGLAAVCSAFDVGNVYFPDLETCENYVTPETNKDIAKIIRDKANIATKYGAAVKYLSPAFRRHADEGALSTFGFGDVTAEVLGPVGTYTIDQFISQDGKCGTKEGHCLNNCSLTVKFSCGNTSFLSCGDIEKQEENNLIAAYETELNSDIMKLSHHGLYTSNNLPMIKAVTPKWAFFENHGYSGSSISNSVTNAKKYGYTHGVNTEKCAMIIDVKDDAVKIYLDKNKDCIINEAPLTGWVKTGSNYQYYREDGTAASKWEKIGSNIYYLKAASGFRATGKYSISGITYKFSSKGVLTSPAKPKKVSLTSVKKSKTTGATVVKWKKVSSISEYQVYRSSTKSGTYEKIATVDTGTLSYSDYDYETGKKYYYKVRGVKDFFGIMRYGAFSKIKYIKR